MSTTSRTVTIQETDGQDKDAVITWEITHTPNSGCGENEKCPDIIHVLDWPEGYIAIPERTEVDEGQTMRILIVRAALS